MVAPLNDFTQQTPASGAVGTADPNMVGMPPTPDTLPDGSPVTQPLDAHALAASLNQQLQQSEQQFAAQQQTIAQLAQNQQQSLSQFTQLAQSIKETQDQQSQRYANEQAEQQRQAQQIPQPQLTAAEQQLLQDQPELSSIIQKNAAYIAAQAAQNMGQQTNQQWAQERQQLQQELEEMRRETQGVRGTVQSRFNSEIEEYSRNLGVDLAHAGKDPNFATWANRPSSPLSSRTIREELQEMAQNYDSARVKAALNSFVAEFYPDRLPGGAGINGQPQPGMQQQQPSQPQPGPQPAPVVYGPNGQVIDPSYFQTQPQETSAAGYPFQLSGEQTEPQPGAQPQPQYPPQQQQQLQGQPGGASVRAPAPNGQAPAGEDIGQKLQQLIGQQNELRVKREGQHISGEEFDTQLASLTSQIFQLRNQQLEQLNQST